MTSELDEWTVRADRLDLDGDPWGQRINLSIARDAATGGQKAALSRALAKLDSEHREHFHGVALAELMIRTKFDQVAQIGWKYGHMMLARVGMPRARFRGPSARDALEAIVLSPAAEHLRRLTIGLFDFKAGGLRRAIPILVRGGVKADLEQLFLGDFEVDEQRIRWVEIGRLSPLLTTFPALERLRVRGSKIELGPFSHPELRRLVIETDTFSDRNIASLGNSSLPKLEHLELWRAGEARDLCVESFGPLFAARDFPELRDLSLQDSDHANALALALVDAPLLAQLRELDLSRGRMGTTGAQAILGASERFRHLESFNLETNFIPPELCAQLSAELGSRVNVRSQRRAPGA